MAYVKNTWVDQKVQRPKTYNFTNNDDGSTTLIDAFGNVEELGTPVNADNMNHIEDGLSTVGMWVYSKTVEYNKDDAVISVVEDKFVLYKSKQNNNKGNALDNKEFWEEVSLGGGGNAGLSLFDLVEKDHILTYEESKGLAQLGTYVYKTAIAGSRYGYPSFYNQCVKEKNAGTATQTQLGDNTVTLYKNDNGHIFYDIASKDAIDAWYNTYGVAWYYGVDTANERIFLPYPDKTVLNRKLSKQIRNGNAGYDLYADGWKKEWGRHTAGTGVGNFSFLVPFANTNYMAQLSSISGTNQTASKSNRGGLTNLSTTGMGIQQAEGTYIYSWIAEGQTNVITDVKANKYFYMCVGNTDVESAITDVIDITTSENDTIPLGWSTYQSGGSPSSAFLASLGQWNSGTLYSTFYNEFVKKIGEAFGAGYVKAHTASDITDYDLVINQDDQTFRLPLKNGSELIADNSSDKITSQLFNSSHPYTATERVFVTGNFYSTGATASEAFINGVRIASEASGYGSFQVILNKGDVLTTTAVATDNWAKINIAPVVGNGTLYYKVSNAVQNLQLMDVAEISEELADKIGRTECKAYITETYVKGTSGYRLYSDHYIEQWGRNPKGNTTVTLLKAFKDTNYQIHIALDYGSGSTVLWSELTNSLTGNNRTTTTFQCGTRNGDWVAKGYIA